jgi:hypothetical protein
MHHMSLSNGKYLSPRQAFLPLALLLIGTLFLNSMVMRYAYEDVVMLLSSYTQLHVPNLISHEQFLSLRRIGLIAFDTLFIFLGIGIWMSPVLKRSFQNIWVDAKQVSHLVSGYVVRTWASLTYYERMFFYGVVSVGLFAYVRSAFQPLRPMRLWLPYLLQVNLCG